MIMKKKVLSVLISFCLFGGLSVAAATEQQPEMIGWATYAAGSKGYSIVTGLANAVQKKTGIKVRAIPTGTNMARVKSVTKGDALLSALYENGMYAAQGGFWDYLGEGPQDLAISWLGYIGNGALLVRGDSGIKTWEDMKGKRVASYSEYDPGTGMLVEAMLAWGGLSYDDVQGLPSTYNSGMDYLKTGKVDIAEGTASASIVYEMSSSVHGVHLIEFDPTDKEAIKRFKAVCPIAGPGKVPVGYGLSEEKPGNLIVYPGYFITKPTSSVDVIYSITKAISEGYDLYKDSHPEAKYWSLESALKLEILNLVGVPYHEGAIKYFKEIGKWTDSHEKWQQSRLKFKDQVAAEFKKALDDAKAQNIEPKSKEFEAFWEPKFRSIRSELALTEF